MANTKLKRAVGVVRPLHGLRGKDEWNLLDGAQGQEARPCENFEKRRLSRVAKARPSDSVREESRSVAVADGKEPALSSLVSSSPSSCSPRH